MPSCRFLAGHFRRFPWCKEGPTDLLNNRPGSELREYFHGRIRSSSPFLPALLAVNPNARLPTVQTYVYVWLAPPTLEFSVAGLLACLASSVLALASHCRQSLLGLLSFPSYLRIFPMMINRGLFSGPGWQVLLKNFLGQFQCFAAGLVHSEKKCQPNPYERTRRQHSQPDEYYCSY